MIDEINVEYNDWTKLMVSTMNINYSRVLLKIILTIKFNYLPNIVGALHQG